MLAVGPTDERDSTLDLLMTAVPNLVQAVENSTLSVVISLTLVVPNLFVSMKVSLQHRVNWNTV